jgi:hypothetical protein
MNMSQLINLQWVAQPEGWLDSCCIQSHIVSWQYWL